MLITPLSRRAAGSRHEAHRGRIGALSVALFASLSLLGPTAGASAPPESGWWYEATSANPALGEALRPPTVPDDGLYISNASTPIAVAAVRLPAPSTPDGTLTLHVPDFGASGQPDVIACPTTSTWEPADGGPMSDAPSYSCDAGAPGIYDPAAGTIDFLVTASMGRGDIFDLALIPNPGTTTAFSLAIEPIDQRSFQAATAPPTTTTTPSSTSLPPSETAAAARPPRSEPRPAVALPPPPASAAVTPTTLAPSSAPAIGRDVTSPVDAGPRSAVAVAVTATLLLGVLLAVVWWWTIGRRRYHEARASTREAPAAGRWAPQVLPWRAIAGATLSLVVLASLLVAAQIPQRAGVEAAGQVGVTPNGPARQGPAATPSSAATLADTTSGGGAPTVQPAGLDDGTTATIPPGGSLADEATGGTTFLPAGSGVRGVTDETIEIGLLTANTAALNAAAGAVSGNADGGLGSLDAEAAMNAQIEYLNSRGGIGGRRIVPVYYEVNAQNTLSASGRQTEAQAACATWTEDHHVFAMVGVSEELLFDCAARTGTVVVSGFIQNAVMGEDRYAAMSQLWYSPTRFTAEERDRAVAQFLLQKGFFPPDARVGLMVEDRGTSRTSAARALRPTLTAAGVSVVHEIHYPDPIDSPWSNYVLQLRQAGVTHVVWGAATSGVVPGMFMLLAAEDQRYRPMWGVGSDQSPDGFITVGNVPPEQLENVVGMGWLPVVDVGDHEPIGPNGAQCDEAMRSTGQSESAACLDILFLLRDAFALAPELSAAGLEVGVEQLGGRYSSPVTIDGATRFGPGDHSGPVVVRMVGFDPSSPQHFQYTSDPESLPQ